MSTRWRPLKEIEDLVQEAEPYWGGAWDLAADVYEDENNVFVEMYLPGIKHKNIEIDAEEDYLRVAAHREEKEEKQDKQFFKKEIRYGSFERIIDLPYSVNPDKAKAAFSEGILKVTLPKQADKTSKKITVDKE